MHDPKSGQTQDGGLPAARKEPWRALRVIENGFDELAKRRLLACFFVGAFALGLRLALLPINPIPEPQIQDEFSYLLQGETFARGRLANPTHPLWPFFETIHVNQQPTYAGKYPPGQALFLAAGIRLFGHPWFGVWFSIGLMCACICWTIQGWLPARYGLLGGLAAAFQFGGSGYWINSYWGGAVAAIGGALLLGALPRLMRKPTATLAVIAAVGVAVLANTRPFEGSVLAVACVIALVWGRRGRGFKAVLKLSLIGPTVMLLSLTAAGMAYYNWRLTGSVRTLPYMLHQRRYAQAPNFWVQPPSATANHLYRDAAMKAVWDWDARIYRQARRNPVNVLITFAHAVLQVFVDGPMIWLIVPSTLGYAAAFRTKRLKLAAWIGFVFTMCVLTEKFVQAHYLAPAVALLFMFAGAGLRMLRASRYRGERVGRSVPLAALAASGMTFFVQNMRGPSPTVAEPLASRVATERQLQELPGRQVVFVRYSERHSLFYEFVYNGPDIDDQKVVWAIDRGPRADLELLRYYPDRTFWLLQPDESPAVLTRYPAK